jgi:hypothetical protein
MNGQERCSASGDGCGRTLDGRLDVEQLGIDEAALGSKSTKVGRYG